MRFFLVLVLCFLFFACNPNEVEKSAKNSSATDSLVNIGGTNLDLSNQAGSRLMAANDCFTCHRIDEKNIGPSYLQIAQQYTLNEGNVENLAQRIITGGTGLWGQAQMTPHPNLPKRQAQEMVRYILSLKDSMQ